MIIDKLNNIYRYYSLGHRFEKALKFIAQEDLMSLEIGRTDIEDDMLFYIVSEYRTKDIKLCKLEGHKKFIDIQYVFCGDEMIGYTPIDNHKTMEKYNSNFDVQFYTGDVSLLHLNQGIFSIFYPDDLHMPGIKGNSNTVKKIVFMVRI